MQQARSEIHAAALDGKIYVAGGIGLLHVLDSCEVFDPENAGWQRCGALPRPLHHVAMAADNEHVYASGGYIALPFKQDLDAALFAMTPATGKWTERARLPHPIGQHAMVHHEGKLYLIGGQNGSKDLATIWTYDIASGDWSESAPMPTPRHSHAIAVAGGKLYVSGGRSAALGTEINIVEMYDFADNKWETLPPLPTGRGGHGSFVRNGKLHVFGGESLSNSSVLASHDILDLETLKWSTGTPMTKPRHGFAVGDDPARPDVYAIGGGAQPGIQTIYSVTGTTQKIKE